MNIGRNYKIVMVSKHATGKQLFSSVSFAETIVHQNPIASNLTMQAVILYCKFNDRFVGLYGFVA